MSEPARKAKGSGREKREKEREKERMMLEPEGREQRLLLSSCTPAATNSPTFVGVPCRFLSIHSSRHELSCKHRGRRACVARRFLQPQPVRGEADLLHREATLAGRLTLTSSTLFSDRTPLPFSQNSSFLGGSRFATEGLACISTNHAIDFHELASLCWFPLPRTSSPCTRTRDGNN